MHLAGTSGSLLQRFGNWYPAIPAVIEATPESAILRNDIIDRPPVRKWTDGRVVLLGDACAPNHPQHGSGRVHGHRERLCSGQMPACAAETPEAGLAAYEQARFDRTAMITNQSWKFGKMFAYENPLKCWFRDRLFGLAGGLAVKQTEKVIGVEV